MGKRCEQNTKEDRRQQLSTEITHHSSCSQLPVEHLAVVLMETLDERMLKILTPTPVGAVPDTGSCRGIQSSAMWVVSLCATLQAISLSFESTSVLMEVGCVNTSPLPTGAMLILVSRGCWRVAGREGGCPSPSGSLAC